MLPDAAGWPPSARDAMLLPCVQEANFVLKVSNRYDETLLLQLFLAHRVLHLHFSRIRESIFWPLQQDGTHWARFFSSSSPSRLHNTTRLFNMQTFNCHVFHPLFETKLRNCCCLSGFILSDIHPHKFILQYVPMLQREREHPHQHTFKTEKHDRRSIPSQRHRSLLPLPLITSS